MGKLLQAEDRLQYLGAMGSSSPQIFLDSSIVALGNVVNELLYRRIHCSLDLGRYMDA